MAAHKKVDYDRIEPAWRAGIKSPSQLAEEYTALTGIPVSRPAIVKYFKAKGIERDLKAKIQAKADAMVAASMVAAKVAGERSATESAIVDSGALAVAGIRLAHRTDITRLRGLVIHLTNEVELQSIRPDFFLEIEALLAGIPKGTVLADVPEFKEKAYKISAALEKALALGTRTVTLKALVESFSRLVALEREAYGINAGALDPEDAMTSMLIRLQGTARTITPVADDIDLLPAP